MSNEFSLLTFKHASTFGCLLTFVALAVPSSAFSQERLSGRAQWSTTVERGKKSDSPARAPRKGEKQSMPAAVMVVPPPPLPLTRTPAAASASVPPVPAGPVEHAESSAPVAAASADRHEYETAALEYCRNIAPAAGEARAAFLNQAIASLEQELSRKTSELDARIAEHKQWIAQRQKMLDQASAALVQMFAKMRPDAAAQQVSIMEEPVAAALLMKLEPKSSSALLSEMPPVRAARLASIIAAVGEISPGHRATKYQTTK